MGSRILPMGSGDCVSLALPGITGAEIPELFGIIVGLLEIVRRRRTFDRAHLMTCSPYVIEHVFGEEVWEHRGTVWPAIKLARRLLRIAQYFDIAVFVKEMPSPSDPTPLKARQEIERRRGLGWLPGSDRWLYASAFKSVFLCVSRNCIGPVDLPPFHFSRDVKCAFNELVLDLD